MTPFTQYLVPRLQTAGRSLRLEGLLILTNDGRRMRSQTQSTRRGKRTVQVEGEATIEMCAALERGVKLKDG